MERHLWEACSNGRVEEVIQLLQSSQINTNWQYQSDYPYGTPFHSACQEGHIDIVKLLLNDGRVDINKENTNGETPFYSACERGHIDIVKLLLNDQRVDINKKRNYDLTPFCVACENGHIEIVKLLLNDQRVDINDLTPFWIACVLGKIGDVKLLLNDQRVDINKPNNYGLTPLYVACGNGHIEVVKLLLNDERVDINKATNAENTPFYIACKNRHIEIVKLLLNDKRVDINKPNKNGWTPFYFACEKGHLEIVGLLLNDQRVDINKPDKNGQTPFYIACEKGHIEIVKLLLNDNRVELNKADDGRTPFWIACQEGHIEIVKLLLNDNRVHTNDLTPFWIACENGNIEIVKLLLNDERVDINKSMYRGFTPFYIACEKGHIELVELLLNDRRVDVNKAESDDRVTPFFIACEKGHIEIVKLLLNDKRVDVNKANYGLTPFYVACFYGHIEIVKLLLNDKRVDINKATNYEKTPFYIACYSGHIDIVKLLLNDERVHINKANENDGKTPFCIVCQKRYIEAVKLLLSDKRVDVNKVDLNKETPFNFACQQQDIEVVKLLLNDKRVDINQVNSYGHSPFYITCYFGYFEIVRLLLNDKRLNKTQTQYDYWASFWMACYDGHIETVKLLLNGDERVDINKGRIDGTTAFFIACQKGHIDIVKLLLNDKRISIGKENYEGKTAIDIAEEENHSYIVELIQEFDTEERYEEYLETFQSFPFFRIENETIDEQNFFILYEYLEINENFKELRLINCGLTPSIALEILKILIWKYENLQLSNLSVIEIDYIELESTEGLESIPIEIKSKGTQEIAEYILDLAKSSQSIYRTKLMVVGYENVGKTTLLDCLFPLMNEIEVPNIFGVNYKYLFLLEGKYLNQYYQGELYKQYILNNRQWNIQEIKEKGLALIPLVNKNQKKLKIYFKDKETRDKWIERLKRVTLNTATHGIEVNTHIWKSSTFNQYLLKNLQSNQNENEDNEDQENFVEFSTWDFAGQHDYYNTHHYFLSNRSIFLVLYRMDHGMKGLESLDFWFKSLSSHLNQNYCDDNGNPFYSIIIVGTFLDSELVLNDDHIKDTRKRRVEEIYDKNGLKSPPFYFEVSCSTLENIGELRETIFNVSLGHSYMGENVPVGYLSIEKSIYELRKLKQDHPIIEIQDLIDHVESQSQFSIKMDIEFVKRALRLLHEWGICIYFDNPIELSDIVVLDPQHFTKTILGDLFKADESIRQMRLNGIIDYSQLNKIWNGPTYLIDTYLILLEKFEVCFILEDQQNKNGNQHENQKKLIIPNLLSEDKMRINEEKLRMKWPETIPRGEIEIERIFSFNQVPSEMVSRLLVRFHDRIVDNIIWRRGVLLKHFNNENILCLLEVKMSENLFEIRIRGKERSECLEMMKYIYEEVKIVSGNYKGVRWKECVRSPHFSKALIDLDDIHQDCKLELKDRKLICPITHFPIYGEELLFKAGLRDCLDSQNIIGNDYWKFTFQSQNQENETKTIFENSEIFDEELFEGLKKILEILGFNLSMVEKVIGNENLDLKEIFKRRSEQIFKNCKSNPNRYKKESWYEGNDIELRKSMIQYLGNYISKFRKLGWNYGNNAFVIPMIQGTNEDAAQRICNDGFSAVPASDDDLGYFSLGVYTTSKEKYARKYCKGDLKVFVIGLMIVGNPFPIVEHPFITDEDGKVVMEKQEQKDSNGMDKYKRKINEKGYFGKPINPGYDSHISLVNGNSTGTAYPITKVEELNEEWTVDELVVNESQTYPCFIVYSQ